MIPALEYFTRVVAALERGDDIAHEIALTSLLSHAGAVQVVAEIQACGDAAARQRWAAIAALAELHCVSRREIERELAELERHLARTTP
jgi:hypothetical protein